MPDDSSREHDDHKKVEHVSSSDPLTTLEGAQGVATEAAYSGSLLGDAKLNNRGNQPVRVALMQRMQRTQGNQATQRYLQRRAAGSNTPMPVQRHPSGASLLENKDEAVAEGTAPPSAEGILSRLGRFLGITGRSSGSGSGTGSTGSTGTGGSAQQTSGTSGTTATTGATGTTTTGGTTPPTTDAGATTDATPTTTTPPPVPSSPFFMELSRAQEILQDLYGTTHTIVPGNMIVLDNREAIWEKYDEVSQGRNNIYVTPNRPWADGDAQVAFPFGLNGFADAGTVYINRMTSSPTTTIHEMLHLNTATGFRAAVGEIVNEGTTQLLTVKALRAANVAIPATIPYQDEMGVAEDLAALVGESVLTQAYFGGAASLIAAVDSALGAGTWVRFKALADARDYAGASAAISRPVGDFPEPTGDTRIA